MATQHLFACRRRRMLNLVGSLVVIMTLGGGAVPTATATDILVGTGAEGSFSNFVGRAICRAINRSLPELSSQAIPGETPTDNLTNLNGGSLDLALIDSRHLSDAMNREGRFAFLDIRYDNLGTVVPLYQQPILLMVRTDAGIETLDAVKGRRINAGVARSATRDAMDVIFAAKGWTRGDFKLVQELPGTLGQDTMAFCHGTIEAMVHIGVHPDSALQQLITLCGAVPVDLMDDAMTAWVGGHAAYSPVSVPAGTYPEVDRAIAGLATTILLVASGSLDEETMRAIMAVLDDHQSSLKGLHPALRAFALKPWSGPALGVDLHPGAAAYFSTRTQ